MDIQDKILQQLLAHAGRDFPNECCGLILNTGYGYQVLECENKAPAKDTNNPGPQSTFLIDPIIYASHADHVAAVYHSHPNRSPQPSAADIASAERANVPFVILSYPGEEIYTYTPKGILPAPYDGRSFVYGVMDCLSLVSDYYLHELGIKINDGSRKCWGWWQDIKNLNAFVDGFKAQGFAIVDKPEINDLVVMSLRSPCPNHVAIYMGDSRILHHPSISTNSRVEMYGDYWRSNTHCFLRYQHEHS